MVVVMTMAMAISVVVIAPASAQSNFGEIEERISRLEAQVERLENRANQLERARDRLFLRAELTTSEELVTRLYDRAAELGRQASVNRQRADRLEDRISYLFSLLERMPPFPGPTLTPTPAPPFPPFPPFPPTVTPGPTVPPMPTFIPPLPT